MSAYAMLIDNVVPPSVRESPNPEPMLRFLETWKDTLPPSALASILENMVMPELVAAADSWSPTWWTEPASV
uniref:GCF C-terminal domain-containing protein n=1 Tax=Oryza punctata TaxID=4537 RepID=A0A0E0KSS4_ORYPU